MAGLVVILIIVLAVAMLPSKPNGYPIILPSNPNPPRNPFTGEYDEGASCKWFPGISHADYKVMR